jgi:hypothetical protein
MDQGLAQGPGNVPEWGGLRGRGLRSLADLPYRAHRRERAAHHLGRSRPTGIVSGLGFEQLCMGENDPQLVVQAVKQRLKVETRLRIAGIGAWLLSAHACGPATVRDAESSERAGDAASRQSVSAKIRMDPPAVRTYSTLPAEIQL